MNISNKDTLNCSGFVCTTRPRDLNLVLKAEPGACQGDCFQPYTFVCLLPLMILWYIIYWLFFILSWYVVMRGRGGGKGRERGEGEVEWQEGGNGLKAVSRE